VKSKTKNLTQQVRDGLLALSDKVLIESLDEWFDCDSEPLEWIDEYRYQLGYQVQSDETETIYASFEELDKAEPDGASTSWVAPDINALRTTLSTFSVEQFYHTVIGLASMALADKASEEAWGSPPFLAASDGYDFMHCLTLHLHTKAQRKPEHGHLLPPQEAMRRRKPMNASFSLRTPWQRHSSSKEGIFGQKV
jgi:hypothetical protein